jgi:hypothetical protein
MTAGNITAIFNSLQISKSVKLYLSVFRKKNAAARLKFWKTSFFGSSTLVVLRLMG